MITRRDHMYGLTDKSKIAQYGIYTGRQLQQFSHPTLSDATSSQLNRSDDSIISATPHIYDASSPFVNDSYSRGDSISNT